MFTLLVSWLLVACIPWLLMLATLGLGRLEKSIAPEAVTSLDVAQFLRHAEASDMRMLARNGMPEALECLQRRQAQRLAELPPAGTPRGAHQAPQFFAAGLIGLGEAGLPTRVRAHS